MKSTRSKYTLNILRGSENKQLNFKSPYMKDTIKQTYKKIIANSTAQLLSDRYIKQNKSSLKHLVYHHKSSRGLKYENKNEYFNISLKHVQDHKKYQQGKACKIIINENGQQKELYIEMTTFGQLNQVLVREISSQAYFKTYSTNLGIDFMLSQQKLNSQFLNGTNLQLKIQYKQKYVNVGLKSFQIIKILGSGGFSKVYLCRFKEDGQFYALKLIDKDVIVKSKKKKIIMNERNIMKTSTHPFIVQMKFAFQTEKYLAFVLQYCPGGQLFNVIKKYRRISQKTAKFYIIELLLGLSYLHENKVVYRDIKPENILLTTDGHIKIADLGLAKPQITQRQMAYSFCGSPQYMSPQMILQQGHAFPVDYYCTGALLYELLTGLPPFYSRDPDQIYQAVLSQELTFPDDIIISLQCKSLMKGLLCKNSKHRLGSLYGVKQILSHPWFGKNNYNQYLNKEIKPPFKFQTIQELNLEEKVDKNKYRKQIETVITEQYNRHNFKCVMKDFNFDYRQNRQNQASKQIKQMMPLKFRKKSTNKNKLSLSLNSNRTMSKRLSHNKTINQLLRT